jgi:pimeloyl-ACP methyl ester carboxylesterase
VLTLTGAVTVYRTFTDPPGVGHFRSPDGRAEYVGHYRQAMAALPTPTGVHDVRTDFGVVRVYEWSTAGTRDTVPVVLVPGRSSGVPMWSVNLPGFVASHRVLAFDALGDAGMSVQSVPLASIEDQAVWIEQVLAALAPGGVHLVGHSFGGATAAAYARLHPARVRSLTLLEPVFTFGFPPPEILWWATVATFPGMPDGIREHALHRIGGGDADQDDADDPVARMITAGSEHFAAELPTPSPLTDDQASRLTMPVYVAIGGRDSLAGGQDAADRAAALLPHVRVQVWPDATHSLPMQEADGLQSVLGEFWARAER